MQKKRMTSICVGGDRFELGCRNCTWGALVRLGLIAVATAEELLPEGFWPVPPPNGGNATWAEGIDPERLAFLQQIGAQPISSVTRLFQGRHYEGWVAPGASGRLVGFVECQELGNALYVFDAVQPTWVTTATKSKWDILQEKPAEFVGRVMHKGDWQHRVLDLLARL